MIDRSMTTIAPSADHPRLSSFLGKGNQSRPDRQFGQRRANSIAVPCHHQRGPAAVGVRPIAISPTQPAQARSKSPAGNKSLARAGSTASRNAAPSSTRPACRAAAVIASAGDRCRSVSPARGLLNRASRSQLSRGNRYVVNALCCRVSQ